MIRTAPAALAWARDLIRPALEEAVNRLSPDVLRVAAYHLGWSDAEGHPTRGDGGKAVRPALALLSAKAAGAPPESAIPGAVAVELVHNFSLLHDDVMDRDRERRHRATAWSLFGEGPAILAGNALLVLAVEVLADRPRPERIRAARALTEAASRMIAGQAEDLAFESRLEVSVDECLEMCGRKTGALLLCACRTGAILAGAGDEAVEALGAFGYHLGLAFQAVDDLLGIWGLPEVTGKPAWNDLRQHKKTLPVVAALAAGAPELEEVLGNGRLPESEVARAAALIEERGGRERTEAEADRQLRLALRSLAGVLLDVRAHEELVEVARFVVGREF